MPSGRPFLEKGEALLNLRNLYRVFRESRKEARRSATLAVVGEGARVEELAFLLGAQRTMRGAEVILTVSGGDSAALSGKGVEHPGEVPLPPPGTGAGELAVRVVRALDEDYLVPLARGYPAFRRAACEEIVRKNARQNALIGALPIPGADMPVMTANQARMVLNIAAAYGEELTLDRARELLGVLAAGFGLRALARQVMKLVPFGGWAAAAAVGYAGTLAMGRATILYFERGGQKVGERELAEIRSRAAEEAKEFIARFRGR
ncbi:hypothetical protein Rxycam_02920 [Rubrobacter xylanophilus DSM 9941]|nr:hypothetical protein Rxycam_02920 [Rubrobacter xylanophilus DSM 9941]